MGLFQRASQSDFSAKKQQSISSFFAKKSTNSFQSSKSSVPSSPNALDNSTQDEDLLIASDERNALGASPTSKVTPKRVFPDGDENGNQAALDAQENLPTRKKPRTSILRDHNDGIETRKSSLTTCNGIDKSGASGRASKYVFSSSPIPDHGDLDDDDEESKKQKQILHNKFVKKLGRPESIAEIKRRHGHDKEEIVDEQVDPEDVEDNEDFVPANTSTKGKKSVITKKGLNKLTPMDKQFLTIKRDNLDAILVVEVGYKYKFFGEDARVAAKELSIVCIPGKYRYDEHASEAHLDRFASASFPVHRLHIHVKRLVNAGHKVGIVRQVETAALKAAGDNRNAPFVRKLTNLYTKGTYIDDVEGPEGPVSPSDGAPATGYLLCISENNANGWGTDEKVQIGIVAVQPATGDIVYDTFEDGFMRSEIETRLLHIAPCEILIVGELSRATNKLVQHLSGSKANIFGDKVRIERVEKQKTMAAQAYSHVSNFYAGKMKANNKENERNTKLFENVLKMSEDVTICLSAMITHMTDYGLEHIFDLTKYFQSFSSRSHMLLNGTSLTSLEIYQNQTDHSEKGSLFWILDRTKTRFGKRLLRKWVGRPLLVKAELEDRIAAVEELRDGERTTKVDKLTNLLSQIRTDLEKSLIRVYYGKCTRPELLMVLQTLQRIANEFVMIKSPADSGFQSSIVSGAIAALPTIADDVECTLDKINLQAAKDDDKYSFFREEMESEDITEHKLGIASVEHDLHAQLQVAADKARKKKLEYVTVAGIEYLIEIENSQLKNVPASWAKISGTKKVSRFHTPEVIRLIRERDQHKESLAAACDKAFSTLLTEISSHYQSFRDCIQALATLDCLLSLAVVASQPGYVKPHYTDSTCIAVKNGRHPMVEQLLLDPYVPNDTLLEVNRTRALLITGPNMGGKSSYVRQVALIAIMGQIGSYVPADSAKLGMLDAVFTRMGALDNMMAGESTFMVELSETSDILKQATSRSLVILDELGRGTSTHDGVAIAQSVLDYVIRNIKSLTLFITHYQNLSSVSEGFENNELKNVHMRFEEGGENGEDITFLYEIGEGIAHRSYGLNVARLANVPESTLRLAAIKSKELEDRVMWSNVDNLSRHLLATLENPAIDMLDHLISGIEQL